MDMIFVIIFNSNPWSGEINYNNYRGQMGISVEGGQKETDQKLPNGEDIKSKEIHNDSGGQNNKENFAGCCQGANGITCCRDGSVEQSSKSEDKKLKDNAEGSGIQGLLGKLSSWIGWEQSEVLTAAAVVGAAATVAVVYRYYRRSG